MPSVQDVKDPPHHGRSGYSLLPPTFAGMAQESTHTRVGREGTFLFDARMAPII